jgi:hypothetical protein
MKKYILFVLTLFTFLTLVSACTEDIIIPDPEGPIEIPTDTTEIPDEEPSEEPGEEPSEEPTEEPSEEPTDPTDPTDPLPGNGSIPASMAGNWFNGVFSFDEFWGYDGNYIGKISENARAFVFNPNGESEMYLTWISRPTVFCKIEAYSHYKGTVVFDEANQSFTFTPTSGTYRGFYSCAQSSNINRPATAEELAKNTTTYYYHMEEVGGIMYMVLKFNPADTHGSYFKRTGE